MNFIESFRHVVSQKVGEPDDDLQAVKVRVRRMIAARGIINNFIFIGLCETKIAIGDSILENY
jgi:hypothetical protein